MTSSHDDTPPVPSTAPAPVAPRWWEMQSLMSLPLADAALAIVFVLYAVGAVRPEFLLSLPGPLRGLEESLMHVVMLEAGYLLFAGTLVDLATRLQKRPPLIVVIALAACIPLFSESARESLVRAWGEGLVVFIPLVVSLFDRMAVLWYMPGSSPLERMRARALTSDRVVMGMVALALFAASLIGLMMIPAAGSLLETGAPIGAVIVLYFAVAAFNEIRVRSRSFESDPKVLLPMDLLEVRKLDL